MNTTNTKPKKKKKNTDTIKSKRSTIRSSRRPSSSLSKSGRRSSSSSKRGKDLDDDSDDVIETMKKIQTKIAEVEGENTSLRTKMTTLSQDWRMAADQLTETRSMNIAKEDAIRNLQDSHRVNIKKFNLSVKNMLLQHQHQLAQLRSQHQKDLQSLSTQHKATIATLKQQIEDQSNTLLKLQLDHQLEIQKIRTETTLKTQKTSDDFSTNRASLQLQFEKILGKEREDWKARHRNDLLEIEKQHDIHTQNLLKNHEETIKSTKVHYESLLEETQDLTHTLKQNLETTRERNASLETQNAKLQSQAKTLKIENKILTQQNTRLKHEFRILEKKSSAALLAQEKCQRLAISIDRLQSEYDSLEAHALQVEIERDELYDRFVAAIFEIQKRSTEENVILEQKLANLVADLEYKDQQVQQVVGKMKDHLNSRNKNLETDYSSSESGSSYDQGYSSGRGPPNVAYQERRNVQQIEKSGRGTLTNPTTGSTTKSKLKSKQAKKKLNSQTKPRSRRNRV